MSAAIKRKADKLVAFGHDIIDASQFYETVKKDKDTKVKIFWTEDQDIDFIEQSIPANLTVLKGTMKLHQIATLCDKAGILQYRDVSCFCGKQRGICLCFEYKKFQMNILHDTQKVIKMEDNNESCLLDFNSTNDAYIQTPKTVFGNKNIEVTADEIFKGTFLLVEILTEKKKKAKYFYIAVTQDELEDDGEVRVMFLKAYDDTTTMYKADDTDIAYVHFDQIKEILPMPTIVLKGDKVFHKFTYSINTFEK